MEVEKQQKEISEEALQLYDRQRFIGIEVQKRLLNAQVFITPMNGINTELAKNLILSGTNITIADSELINEDDVETNFMIAPSDIGQVRGEVIGKKLKEMNPMVDISIFKTFDINKYFNAYYSDNNEVYQDYNKEFLSQFNIITSSTKNFSEIKKYEFIISKLNIPYYNLLCCGLFGYYYVNLGEKFEFINKKHQVIQFKNGQKVESEHEYFEKVIIDGYSLQETLKQDNKSAKPIYKAINVMYIAEERNLSYNPFQHNEEVYQQIISIIDEIYPNLKQDQKNTIQQFVKFFGIDYCPVYSVIGSIASQEFIKVIGRDQEPGLNYLVYDSQEGYGKLENIQGAKNYKRQDLPELTRKKEI